MPGKCQVKDSRLYDSHMTKNRVSKSATTILAILVIINILPNATASGGYRIGQKGPGGGNVFYVSKGGFPCGPTLKRGCHYLEAAPTIGTYAWRDVSAVWSGNTTQTLGEIESYIGTGYRSTLLMLKMKHSGKKVAAALARGYHGDNKSDWYLPSIDELEVLWIKSSAVGGPMKDDYYWASSDSDSPGYANCIDFGSYEGPYLSCPTGGEFYVRPIRAF